MNLFKRKPKPVEEPVGHIAVTFRALGGSETSILLPVTRVVGEERFIIEWRKTLLAQLVKLFP
jgi:hypothetical protein